MSKLMFYGASDDLVELDGDKRDEYCAMKGATFTIGGKLRVRARYRSGVWSFEVSQVEEEIPIPSDWRISLSQHERGYSMLLTIEASEKLSVVRTFKEKT